MQICKKHKTQKSFDTYTQSYLCSQCVEKYTNDLTKWYKEVLGQ